MASVRYYLDLRRAKSSGMYPIRLYVRHKNRIIIATDFDSSKENWTGSEFSKKEPNFQTKNSMLRELMRRVELKLLELDTAGRLLTMSDSDLKDQITPLISSKRMVNRNFLYYLDIIFSRKVLQFAVVIYSNFHIARSILFKMDFT